MPLARFQLRNEFGLGKPELYSEASREDPKAVLDGIAVAGLVGILRQLGDLAEFAAEVFHGLQEQVIITASRSHNMMVRVQHLEAALPPLEKRVLAQTSHLPFAYTAGSDWHVRIRNEQHQFIDNDLPRFIMDSYEECRDPPRLHLLDKFDTDGPGSCLRRYSDPTFFRRVSMKFDEPNTVNMRRDKKGHKVKKKRSFPKNGEYSRGTSMSKSSGRMKFSSSAYNGRTSPSISVDDVRFKSGMRDSRNSLGSRSESGYIECTFDQNENEPLEELGSYRSSSSMMIQHDDSIDSVSQDEKIWTVENSSAQPTSQTSQGRVASNASSVTWDEKTEILEPTDQKRDTEEPIAMISSTYSDVDEQEEVVNIPTVEFNVECKEDIRSKSILLENSVDDEIEREADNCVVDGIPKPILHENQVDDIDSELDCYVDALNTIESESETDHDYQMNREMEQHMAEVEYTETSASVQEPMSQSPVHHISGMESNGDSDSTSNKEMPSELLELAPPESSAETQIPEAAGEIASSDCLPSISMLESSDLHVGSNSKRECDEFAQRSSGSIPTTNVIPSYFPEHHESPMKLAAANFWTNGGLLGLQPSKPADFAPSNNADARKRDKDITAHPTDHNSVTTDGRDKTGILGENCDDQGKEARSNHPTSFLINKDNQSTKKTALVSSLADLYARYDKSCDSDPNNKGASISGNGSSSITLVAPGSAMPVAPTAKVIPVESRKESDENLSGVFGLRQRLFVNSFRKKIPFVYDEKSEQASSTKARVMEQFEVGSPVNSVPPSPPLEHMKISFHPVNDFETSKLGLKFAFDKNGQESIRDSFASFQLVPETSVGLHDLGSVSDDDTFYRSSPCTSDGCLSRDSDSNSEQWEFGGTAKVGVQDQCDVNIVAEGQRSQALNLLSFDSFESLPKPENDMDSCQSTPSLPPPPPAEWRASKPQEDMGKEEEQVPGVPNHDPEPEHLLSSSVQELPQQQVVHSMQHTIAQEIIHVTADRMSSLQDYQQKHASKEAYQSGNYGKVMDDEKEDFLQQIRTKSFNLRRTVPAKDASGAASVATTPTPNANVKVSAILEKANAIRQAVGSDDGEDDSWSDT